MTMVGRGKFLSVTIDEAIRSHEGVNPRLQFECGMCFFLDLSLSMLIGHRQRILPMKPSAPRPLWSSYGPWRSKFAPSSADVPTNPDIMR